MFSSILDKNKQIEVEVKRLGIFELRGLAREVGVSSPTTKKREELISLILDKINKGQIEDVVGTKKGRPFKKLAVVDNILNNMTSQDLAGKFAVKNKISSYEDVLAFAQVMPVISNVENKIEVCSGIVRKSLSNELFVFYDFETAQTVFISEQLKNIDKIENGDVVSVKAKKINNNQYYATEILSINKQNITDYKKTVFDKGEQIISDKTLSFENKSLFVGRRNLILLQDNFYENSSFEKLYKSAIQDDYQVVFLSLNSSIEDEIKMKSMGNAIILSSKFNDSCEMSLNKTVDCISLCENLLNKGKKVLLIIPDLINAIRAIDCCFIDEKKMYDHSMQSIIVVQRLLSLGGAFKNDCNTTLLIGINEFDKNDSFLNNQLYKICKII